MAEARACEKCGGSGQVAASWDAFPLNERCEVFDALPCGECMGSGFATCCKCKEAYAVTFGYCELCYLATVGYGDAPAVIYHDRRDSISPADRSSDEHWADYEW